jgi:starch synthase
MRVAHLLRKLNPAEWGGTETAIQRLVEGLCQHEVESVVYCPRLSDNDVPNPPSIGGCAVKRFNACLPVWGISAEQRRQMISVGGNLMSFDLIAALWREPDLSVVHTHTLGRLGGIALTIAKWRRLPLVASIHGGVLDLPGEVKAAFKQSAAGGWEWGKIFGAFLQARRLLVEADAIITCNVKEAELLGRQHPRQRIIVQPHGVPVEVFQRDCRENARQAFPQIRGRQILLCAGRIDPVKNQRWLIEQAPELLRKHPQALLVLAGPCTNQAYGAVLQNRVLQLGLQSRVLLTGGLPPEHPRLVGLLQDASVVLVPSISETFGLVILEAWAAGASVVASRTTGASALVQDSLNGRLFDLDNPQAFHAAVDSVLFDTTLAAQYAAAGRELVSTEYDTGELAGRLKLLYEQLIEEKHAPHHPARRRHECADTARVS